ncbi:MAG: serine/threonine-protein kinase [Nannocystaceae bacterium]
MALPAWAEVPVALAQADAEALVLAARPSDQFEARGALAEVKHGLFGDTAPATLGRFVLLERLGSGGAGIVHAAYDPRLDRKVALKLLRADTRQPEEADASRSRLLHEARSAAKVVHPNVIVVYDAGVYHTEDVSTVTQPEAESLGGVYLVMEYVEGTTISGWLACETRHWKDVVRIFLAAGRGLASAHARGIVHGDFKPPNVMIGEDDRVRVLDFGLALAPEPSKRSDRCPDPDRVPRPGSQALGGGKLGARTRVMGTPAYLAPELLDGRPADERSDQFSFCAALYEGLYGVQAFPDATLRSADKSKYDVPRPPAGTPRVPGGLHRVLLRGMAPDPEARFVSLAEVLAQLEGAPRRRVVKISVLLILGLAAAGAIVCLGHQGRF